jgi:FMN phosphatase YigB (HAD superfamily)
MTDKAGQMNMVGGLAGLLAGLRLSGRHFAAPDGNELYALFVDLDGTALVCRPYFQEATRAFKRFMTELGVNGQEAAKTLEQHDNLNLEHKGFGREPYRKTMLTAYKALTKKHGLKFSDSRMEDHKLIVSGIAKLPFFREPELFPNVVRVLQDARKYFLIIGVTGGSDDAQSHKVREAGLKVVFDHVAIVSRSNKPEQIAKIMSDCGINASLSAHIGNDMRDDVACLQVTNVVHLPLEASRRHAKIPQDTGFELFHATSWLDAYHNPIQSLIRRRLALELRKAYRKDVLGRTESERCPEPVAS